jgi:hypothetical protein
MAGTFTAKSIADGQVANSQTAIYTVPASRTGYVKQVTFFNTNAAAQTLIVWIKRSGGTSRKIRQFTLAQNESVDFLDDGDTLELSTGDAIEASTTTATAVDYVVMGVEET